MRFIIFALFLCAANVSAQKSQSPHGELKITCGECHSTASWTFSDSAKFNHNSTGFSLAGYHKNLACKSCHKDLKFSGQTAECAACHADVHRSELGDRCERCHGVNSWIIPDMKQKHQQTRFALLGRHAQLDCGSCHERASVYRFGGTPITCVGCHEPDYTATSNPSHVKELFQVDCRNCHNITASSWSGSFDHSLTAFPLTGAHRAIICFQCHTNNQFKNLSGECYSCHLADFTNAGSPDHVAANLSHRCQTCHSTAAWTPSTFNHASTNFALTGRHTATPCQSCHTGGNYQLVYGGCYPCHETDYRSSDNPDHLSGGFSTDCTQCHSTEAWEPAAFDHSATTFPLTGRHTTTQCQSCHTGGNYQLTYSDCYACHQDDYARPADPNHATANFPHDCSPCHSTSAWSPSTFDHDQQYFRIYSGAHREKWSLCADCHTTPSDYKQFSCVACHEHNQTEMNAKHTEVAGYLYLSSECYRCHQNVR